MAAYKQVNDNFQMKSCDISLIVAKKRMRALVYNRNASLNQVVPSLPALFSISGSAHQQRSSGSNLRLKRLDKSIRLL